MRKEDALVRIKSSIGARGIVLQATTTTKLKGSGQVRRRTTSATNYQTPHNNFPPPSFLPFGILWTYRCIYMDDLNTADRLRDEFLFKEPPPKDDCPICFVPMPSAYTKIAAFHPCCGKIVCNGCVHSCDGSSTSGDYKCPFCNAEVEYDKKKVYANEEASESK